MCNVKKIYKNWRVLLTWLALKEFSWLFVFCLKKGAYQIFLINFTSNEIIWTSIVNTLSVNNLFCQSKNNIYILRCRKCLKLDETQNKHVLYQPRLF